MDSLSLVIIIFGVFFILFGAFTALKKDKFLHVGSSNYLGYKIVANIIIGAFSLITGIILVFNKTLGNKILIILLGLVILNVILDSIMKKIK